MKITKQQARRFLIAYQGIKSYQDTNIKENIMDYFKKVGCIQFDPLDQVGYNPSLVLQSRIKGFKVNHLYELLYKEHRLVDAWDKNMAIYPVEDWPYFDRYRKEARERVNNGSKEVLEIIPKVREQILLNGPSSSLDFSFDTIVDWAWSPTKASRAALESMFYQGDVVVSNKIGTRRIYDLTERFLPEGIRLKDDPNIVLEEYYRWHVKRRIGAIGLLWNRLSDAWLGIHWMKTKERNEAFLRLEQLGEIVPIEVDGLDFSLYIRKEDLPLLEQIVRNNVMMEKAAFLAPLDNMLWDRKLIEALFGFVYRWEVYKPVAERDYGYYVLPVLYGDQIIGRFEPVYSKKTKTLSILNWWWEKDYEVSQDCYFAINESLKEFVEYLGGEKIIFEQDGKTTKTLKSLKKQLKNV